jgi:hypothetical protein
MPSFAAIGDALFWVLGAFLVFHLIRGGGCCGRQRCGPAEAAEEADE